VTRRGRVLLVTGAASGLGWALSRLAHARGDFVVLADRDAAALEARRTELPPGRTECVVGDVTVEADRAAMLTAATRRFGGLDVLVNNAGITHRSPARLTDPAVIRRVMDVDYHAPVALTLAALPLLRERGGSVVAISSMAGWMPVPGRAGYGAAKAALTQYFEVLRLELAPLGVHVLLAHPSFLDTPIERHALGADGAPAPHRRSTIGAVRSAEHEATRILAALDARRATVRTDPLPAVAALLWRLAPGWYRRAIVRRFAGEL
jgi:NAD(P)-dependent dehydrogenase (short-subunit alcohol dehydrogenase family)